MKFVVGAVFALLSACAYAQNDATLVKLEKEYRHISADLQRQSLRLLKKLQAKDSEIVILRNKLLTPPDSSAIHLLKEYLPALDSVQTALQFLIQSKLPSSNLPSVQQMSGTVMSVQDQLQKANEIQSFVQGKLQQWQNVPKIYRQRLYYYKEQVQQYKQLLHDPDKLANKFMSILRDQPAFRAFFLKNSYMAALFRLPGSSVETPGQPLQGLQTRAQVTALVEERLGPGASFASAVSGQTTGGSNPIAGNMQQAQDQMNQLKNKVAHWGDGSDANVPDFKPNPYHSKTFFQRIQLGFDVQSQSCTRFIPALSTFGLIAGYLLNANSIIGIGAAYKLGWGQPFEHIAFSGQGMALKTFIDWRLKGSWWMAGGYEANYYNAFSSLSQLPSVSSWQSGALMGLMKTYKAGRRSGNIQLLFDALYRQHVPQSPPVVFRVGYML